METIEDYVICPVAQRARGNRERHGDTPRWVEIPREEVIASAGTVERIVVKEEAA